MPAQLKTRPEAMRARVADEVDAMHAHVGWEINPNPALREWLRRQAQARRARRAAENDAPPQIQDGSDTDSPDED